MGNTQSFDVVIIGGGAAGSAAALTLQQEGTCSVAIVEKSDFSEARVGETIPPDANPLLAELGVTEAFQAQKHIPCYGSHTLWGSTRLGHNDFVVNIHSHGWHLNRSQFDAMLLDQCELAGVEVFRGAHFTTACYENDHINKVSIRTKCGDTIDLTASQFLDASGRNAVLTNTLSVPRKFDDKQVVVWARFRLPKENTFGNSTWLESVPYGWWYGARLPDREAIVALGTDPYVAKDTGVYDIKSWLFLLADTGLLAPHLSQAHLIPSSFRITSSHSYCLYRATGDNWFAIGDTASAFDPLSSAGIYKALQTGQLAARAILSPNLATQREAYQARIQNDYLMYLEVRRQLYETEQRWHQYPFWAARYRSPPTQAPFSAPSFI